MATKNETDEIYKLFATDVENATYKLTRYVRDRYKNIPFLCRTEYSEEKLDANIILVFNVRSDFVEHKIDFISFIGEKYYYAGGIEYMYNPKIISPSLSTITYSFNIRKDEESYKHMLKSRN